MARTGEQYIAGLKDERTVWLGSEKVAVTEHPALAGSLRGMAGYFDWQHRFSEDCLVDNPDADAVTNACLLLPKTPEDLAARHRSFERIARYSYGMLGRTPDYVQTVLSGFAARDDGFAADGDTRYGDRVRAYHREVAQNDLSLTHAIIQPTIDKSSSPVGGVNEDLPVRVVARKSDRLVVRGARVLATKAPFADEIFVYPAHPLPPDAPEEYAIVFAMPIATSGIHVMCRDHTGVDGSPFDKPFSSRFDEQDAFIIFDDVEVPMDRVFIDGAPDVYGKLLTYGWASNVLQQTSIRSAVKLEFIYDLCVRISEITNSKRKPDVAAMLGELRTYGLLIRAAIRAAEVDAFDHGNGAFFLDPAPLRAVKNLIPQWMERANDIVISLGSHNLLCTPAGELLDNAEIGELIETYLPGANDYGANERIRVFRTAWDLVGSALGARVALYERYYLASQATNFILESKIAEKERTTDSLADFFSEMDADSSTSGHGTKVASR
jgi:4-hydroxyphenylacetate 3-monooxygenase/anthranilate 3-monooxygenase (FAD)/4-hydroxyphenylacetate 3-monooxygenase